MLETKLKVFPFNYRTIWFSDSLYDVDSCDSVIFRLCRNKMEKSGFRMLEEFHTLTTDLTRSLDDIWKGMSKSNCRKPINHAIKSGVVIKRNEHYEEFYSLYQQLRKTKGFNSNNLSIEYLKEYGTLFTAIYEGDVLGGMVYLEDENTLMEIVTASKRFEGDKEKRNFVGSANKMVIWEAMQYAKAKGIREYDHGGIHDGAVKDEQLERINNYKQSFGGQLSVKYSYRKDYSRSVALLKKYVLKD